MQRSMRTQGPLFLALCAFTAVTLVPVVWAVLTSFKRPVDAFAVPPEFIFPPTFEFHYEV
jgi:multiple sugar transport system permease protein